MPHTQRQHRAPVAARGRAVPIARALGERAQARAEEFADTDVIERIWARDHTVWKPAPTEIADRLGWLDVHEEMIDAVDDLVAFAGEVMREGYTTAVVLGMGGSSLAPRVLATAFGGQSRGLGVGLDLGLDVIVLDSTVPDAIRAVEARAPLGRTLFIASSKSGTTLESAALLDYFWEREPDGRHFVAITDEGTALEVLARERYFRRVFVNRADIGGRFSALSYVGLVPAALLGLDLLRLLQGARHMADVCQAESQPMLNPGAQLGILIGEAARLGHDALTLRVEDGIGRFGAWLEQLIAESTGKEGRGILPVCEEPIGPPEAYGDSRFFMAIGGQREAQTLDALADGGRLPVASYSPGDAYRLGGEFFRWELAVAVAGRVLGINPFDQPDVEATKRATSRLLQRADAPPAAPALGDLLAHLERSEDDEPAEYVSIHAYLPRTRATDTRLSRIRAGLRNRYRLPTTVEYGPSLLHSTGQYHKGGRRRGAFVQITERDPAPLAIPGRDYDFGTLARAQAEGDRQALEARGRFVARASLDDLEAIE